MFGCNTITLHTQTTHSLMRGEWEHLNGRLEQKLLISPLRTLSDTHSLQMQLQAQLSSQNLEVVSPGTGKVQALAFQTSQIVNLPNVVKPCRVTLLFQQILLQRDC